MKQIWAQLGDVRGSPEWTPLGWWTVHCSSSDQMPEVQIDSVSSEIFPVTEWWKVPWQAAHNILHNINLKSIWYVLIKLHIDKDPREYVINHKSIYSSALIICFKLTSPKILSSKPPPTNSSFPGHLLHRCLRGKFTLPRKASNNCRQMLDWKAISAAKKLQWSQRQLPSSKSRNFWWMILFPKHVWKTHGERWRKDIPPKKLSVGLLVEFGWFNIWEIWPDLTF